VILAKSLPQRIGFGGERSRPALDRGARTRKLYRENNSRDGSEAYSTTTVRGAVAGSPRTGEAPVRIEQRPGPRSFREPEGRSESPATRPYRCPRRTTPRQRETHPRASLPAQRLPMLLQFGDAPRISAIRTGSVPIFRLHALAAGKEPGSLSRSASRRLIVDRLAGSASAFAGACWRAWTLHAIPRRAK